MHNNNECGDKQKIISSTPLHHSQVQSARYRYTISPTATALNAPSTIASSRNRRIHDVTTASSLLESRLELARAATTTPTNSLLLRGGVTETTRPIAPPHPSSHPPVPTPGRRSGIGPPMAWGEGATAMRMIAIRHRPQRPKGMHCPTKISKGKFKKKVVKKACSYMLHLPRGAHRR